MTPFFLSAILCSLTFWLVLIALPPGAWLWRKFEALWASSENQRSSPFVVGLALTMGMLTPIALVSAVAALVYPEDSKIASFGDLFFSESYKQILYGAVFAAIFTVWIARAYKLKPKEPFPRALKVELGMLVFVFLVGANGVLAPYLQRLTSFKGAGLEIGLTPVTSTQAQNRQPPPTTPSNDAGAPLAGLTMLSHLDLLMRRDNEYIGYLGATAGDKVLDEVIDTVGATVSALAQCHQAIYDRSGDLEFTRREFSLLQPVLHAYARSAPRRANDPMFNAFATRLASATLTAAMNASNRAFAEDLSLSDATDNLDASATVLYNSCWDIAVIPCRLGPGLSLPNSSDRIRRDYCEAFCDDSSATAAKTCEPGNPHLSKITDFIRKRLAVRVDPSVAGAVNCSVLCINSDDIGYLADKLKDVVMLDPRFESRPYMDIVYASIAELSLDNLAALQALSEWRRRHDERKSIWAPWYDFRALFTMILFADEWLNNKATVSSSERKFVLGLYADISRATDTMSLFTHQLDAEQVAAGQDFDQTLAASPVRSGKKCAISDEGDIRNRQLAEIRAAQAKLTLSLNYLDKLLQDPEYVQQGSVDAERIVRNLVLDLSCLQEIILDDPPHPKRPHWIVMSDALQAEIRRLEAKRLFLNAQAADKILTSDEFKAKLAQADDLLTMARKILRPDIVKDPTADTSAPGDAARKPPPSVMQEVAPAEAFETLNQINSLRSQVRDKLEPAN